MASHARSGGSQASATPVQLVGTFLDDSTNFVARPWLEAVLAIALTLASISFSFVSASAAPSETVSFYSLDPASSAHGAPNHSAIVITEGSVGAGVTVHGFASTVPSTVPSFTTTNYGASSPPWYITFSDGSYVFGYPEQGGNVWELHDSNGVVTYPDWTGVQTSETSKHNTVTGVFIVVDADQSVGTVNMLNGIQYDGQQLSAP